MESTLTTFQSNLIKDLTKEFARLNPKELPSGKTTRFSIATIENCISEKQKFIDSVKSYNASIAKVLRKVLEKDLKSVGKEFSKYLTIQDGRHYATRLSYTIDELFQKTNDVSSCNHAYIYLVGKIPNRGCSDNGTKGFSNVQLYLRFTTVYDKITLQSGKEVAMNKIIGLQFCNQDASSESSQYAYKANSLESLIQLNQSIQQRIVELAK